MSPLRLSLLDDFVCLVTELYGIGPRNVGAPNDRIAVSFGRELPVLLRTLQYLGLDIVTSV